MIRFSLTTLTIATILSSTTQTSLAARNGDKCGVTSSDFLSYDYRGEVRVAGQTGCTLGEDEQDCFCAPNLADGESLSEWEWQCNGKVAFGPSTTEKICPDLVPVAKGLGLLEVVSERSRGLQDDGGKIAAVGTESMQSKTGIPCDTAIHPTGRPGDEVCPYSDCETGGNHSAVCACVDLGKYGMGVGMEWVCMHATCSCGDDQENSVESLHSSDQDEALEPSDSGDSVEASAAGSVGKALASISGLTTMAVVLWN